MSHLNLIRDERGTWLDAPEWPETFRAPGSLIANWRKPETDLIDIRLENARAIYEIVGYNRLTQLFHLELRYFEMEPAPKDVVR